MGGARRAAREGVRLRCDRPLLAAQYRVARRAAADFAAFAVPGWGKIVADFSVVPHGEHASLLTYECRTTTTDIDSRARFLRYWRLVRPFVGHIFRATVATIAAAAESD
jgi:hypothetical protein